MERKFYDIHTHIVPNVDDGSKSLNETRAMLEIAYQDGIRSIIATPHYILGRSAGRERIREKYELLKEEAARISDDLYVYLGNELYYSSGILDELQEGNAFTLAESRYVLVEFSVSASFREIKQGILDLMMSGYRPILAHIERYQALKEIEVVDELSDTGCYFQINSSSFLGGFMDRRAKYCKKLICSGYVHLIGSDCHNTKERRPMMNQTYQYLCKYVNQERLNEIFFENPQRILENKYI